ncbi:MAG TPA: hypothetical protein EYN06_04155 [Myxococcales bacterium]|nr:hypothetical protein [Myxococcales bacterium]HIN85653.1 hypothetical protein [Myxococcales bacterium]
MKIMDDLQGTMDQFQGWVESSGPKLLGAVVILVVGWLIAKLVKAGLVKFLKMVKLDTVAEKAGIDRFLARGNIQNGSTEVLGVLVYWMLLFLTLLIAAKTLGLTDAQALVGDVLSFIPKVILAVVILIVGLSFSGFVADVVQTGAVNAQVREARMLSNLSRWSIVILVAIMALNQVDIDTNFMSQAFLILFAALCLAMALAFGLGCRDLAGRVAQQWWDREQAETKALADASDNAGSDDA